MQARRRVILDCDPGHDDALAILLAAASPQLDLAAITTVAGNQTLEKVTLNALRVCSVAGIDDVPVAAGCDRPLVRDPLEAASIHGESGLDGPEWDSPNVVRDPRHAVDLMAEELVTGAPVTIIATGPLTNVATLLRRADARLDGIEQIVLMGGAIGLGNWTPSAEFNMYADPEAADAVFSSGLPVTMVPLEVTHRALATPDVMARIDPMHTPVARMSATLLRFFAETYERVFGFAAPAVHDPCAVAAVIDPAIVKTVRVNVAVDTTPGISYGRTVCDMYRTTGRTPNADVGVDLQVERFWDAMIGAIGSYRR
jgi:inosine/uridine nucleosidase